MGICSSNNSNMIPIQSKEVLSASIRNTTIKVVYGDITLEKSDLIVNQVSSGIFKNERLIDRKNSNACDFTVHDAVDYLNKHKPLALCSIYITSLEKLNFQYVLNAVVPIYIDGEHNEKEYLIRTLWKILSKAEDLKCNSLSIPTVSAGIFGYPKQESSELLLQTILVFIKRNENSSIKQIRIVNNDVSLTKSIHDEIIKQMPDSVLLGRECASPIKTIS